jgi:pilus assembly protein CpaC
VQYDKNSHTRSASGGLHDRRRDDRSVPTFLAGTTNSAATLASQPLPSLDIAARHGWAKVLKQSTVITSNDAEAVFSSGGEQNFPINTGLTIGVQKIQFGTNLTVLPHYEVSTRELALKIDADVSDLTRSVSGRRCPGA